jgi:putative hydrolase of HD superfamily
LDALEKIWLFSAKLKQEPRRGWPTLHNSGRIESVADHSFAVAILALVEAERRHLHVENTIKMALLHDFEESITGDLTPSEKIRLGSRKVRLARQKAIKSIVQLFPSSLRQRYHKLWNEYIENVSDESKLVHQLDKLEMAFQAFKYARQESRRKKFSQFYKTAESSIKDKHLKTLLRKKPEKLGL